MPVAIRRVLAFAVVVLAAWPAFSGAQTGSTGPLHAVAEFGEVKYGPDFPYFDYVNPDAPKGGFVTLRGARQTFEGINTIADGEWATEAPGLHDATLMAQSQDELSSAYGYLAETVEIADDVSWAQFVLREEARFGDGEPVRADDVVFTFEAVKSGARPFLRAAFEDVVSAEIVDDLTVRFTFDTTGVMQPVMRVALNLPIYPRHWWEADEDRDPTRQTFEDWPGAGPYEIVDIDEGRSITYRRKPDWWAVDLPAFVGTFNFDRIRYIYIRDADVAFEAFLAGEYDFRWENSSRRWSTGYDTQAVADRLIRQRAQPQIDYRGVYGFFLNTRRAAFADIRARRAVVMLYPFEWVQANVMYGLYQRVDSYFPGSEYAARGLPEGIELAALEPFRDRLPPEVFGAPVASPANGPRGVERANRRLALRLLGEAGFEVRDGVLVDAETGEPFTFTVLLRTNLLEPHTQPWLRELEQIGIRADIRLVDSANAARLLDAFDFDAIPLAYTFFPPPGPELRSRFGSEAAEQPGSANWLGVRDPVVDALIDRIVVAPTLADKEALTRALDRVLLAGHYVVPAWYNDAAWLAYWDRFGWPETDLLLADYSFPNEIGFQPTWWVDPVRDAALEERR